MLSGMMACASADEIMAGLLRLDPDRFDDIRARVGLLAAYCYTGRAEDLETSTRPTGRPCSHRRPTPR